MSTLLVIGGTGFFGKSILDSFKRGCLEKWNIDRVISMSRHAESLHKDSSQLISSNVELYSSDIATTEYLPYADIVIHAAASTDTSKYLSNTLNEQNNIRVGTYNYCKLAEKFHVDSKILYVSSGAIYGRQPEGMTHISEEYFANDLSNLEDGKRDYALAKHDAEDAVKELGLKGMSVSIARCFSFVGPWLPRNQHFAIGNFIEDGLFGRPITVQTKNQVFRSYMYTDDLVEWLMTIAVNANPFCSVYNVGSNEPIQMQDLAILIAHEFGVDAQFSDISDTIVDRYIPSVVKANYQLGLTLQNDLISSIRKTIECIKSNKKSYLSC
jgi:nucleoside-diphosphate-sugar epimerase